MTAAHLYIAACLIVAGLDIYIGLKVYNMYFSQPEYLDDPDTQEGDDQ
jgi:hypothetical protein